MEENGHKETDEIKIELNNLGTVNKNEVTISTNKGLVRLYFSYKTLVAVNGFVSVNNWSNTTGKLLNELEPNKSLRLPHKRILEIAQESLNQVLK